MFDFIVQNGGKIIAVAVAVIIVMTAVVLFRVEKYGSGARVVTLHYTSWCGHCARMKPVWAQVRAACKGRGIVFVESDEEKNRTPGIDSYPTIVMINEYGVREQYQSGPDFDQLHKWVTAVRNPIVF